MRKKLQILLLIFAVAHSTRADDKSKPVLKDAPLPLTAPFSAEQAAVAQEIWAKSLGKSSPVEKNSIGMELVLIPPGRFTMGSPPGEEGRIRNVTQVEVTLTTPLYLGKTEVTQREWCAVMGTTPWQEWDKGRGRVREGENYPAVCISWDKASEFCEKLSTKEKRVYRLPTEAEWEYACRGGQQTPYNFGDDQSNLGDHGWFKENASDRGEVYAHEVKLKKANPFGLFDMHGNVVEWCSDLYAQEFPGGVDPEVSITTPSLTERDRRRARRVVRDGSFLEPAEHCRSDRRRPAGQSQPVTGIFGFRVAWSPAGGK